MKHRIVLGVLIILFVAVTSTTAFASTSLTTKWVEKEVFPDGSYAVVETVVEASPISLYATETKSASRTYTYYTADDVKAWDFTLKGTFSYNGTTAKATDASTSCHSYLSGWACATRDAWTSGATAKGSATFQYKSQMYRDVVLGLTCSANGTISAA